LDAFLSKCTDEERQLSLNSYVNLARDENKIKANTDKLLELQNKNTKRKEKEEERESDTPTKKLKIIFSNEQRRKECLRIRKDEIS